MSVGLAVDLINSYALDPTYPTPELLVDVDDLEALLRQNGLAWPHPLTDREVTAARRVRSELRRVFDQSDPNQRARVLAPFVERAVIRLVPHGDRVTTQVEAPMDGFRDWLGTTAGLGLARFIEEFGFERLGICQAVPCQDVYADATHNQSKRYCSDRCSNRLHAALHRERLRAVKRQALRATAASADSSRP